MQPDRFTIKSQEALQAAQRLADDRRNPQTTPEHLLAVLLEQEGGVVAPVLRKLGAEPAAVRQALAPRLDALPKLTAGGGRDEPAGGSTELTQILRTAETEMRDLQDEYVSAEHLLLALAAHPGGAGDALRSNGATRDELIKALSEVRGSHR
ncbi:MAG: Clp protease N-terminal domain-containing protein, partial [Solirubrobacteraceae bacterium]